MTKRVHTMLYVLLAGLGVVVLGILLADKLQLGINRYFDADEFAYLHWAHNVFTGRIPYKDFLSYIPPGFFYLLAPLFWFTNDAGILYLGRIFSFLVFSGLVAAVIVLFWQMRGHLLMAVTAGLLLAFIPIPADKFIEVRPDNAAMLFAVLGLIVHGLAFASVKKTNAWFVAGVLYMASLLILPKTLPQVVAAMGVSCLWWWKGSGVLSDRTHNIMRFAAGLLTPFLIFCGWILISMRSMSELSLVWYSLTKLPFETQRISAMFPILPYLYFYPNNLLYGSPGWNIALIINHAVWLLGLMTGAIRLTLPFLANGKKGVWTESAVAGAFLGYIASFMYGYPMRHEQYLIPVSIFVVFYAADGLTILGESMPKKSGFFVLGGIVFIVFLSGMVWVNTQVNEPKMAFSNANDYRVLNYALQTIPRGSYVFDLVGSTIYYADPYYVSAVPFGQWAPYLSRPLPNIPQALEKTRTGYVYEGQLGRLDTLPADAVSYIRKSYRPSGVIPGMYSR